MGAYCFFPANRHEEPHWFNPASSDRRPIFEISRRITDKLGKPIVIERSATDNKNWLLDVFLDSLVDVAPNPDGGFAARNLDNAKILMKLSRTNVERLLKSILFDETAEFTVGLRYETNIRLAIKQQERIVIPSLDHLSSGQAILFNLFATIIRYADIADANKSIFVMDIEGIVVIDEADAHLHSDLQYDLLPKLISMFPKVQFIITSHSPLFLLGMEKKFGSDGIQIIEMPIGNPITTERFSEFKRSLDYYKSTKAYEEEMGKALVAQSKPLVLMEGETDPIYLKAALEVHERRDLTEAIDIEWIGAWRHGESGPFNTGDSALNHAKNFIEANPGFSQRVKTMLLYDWDASAQPKSAGNLFIRKMPKIEENRDVKGVENLLPSNLLEDRFYTERREPCGNGRNKIIPELDKARLCKWVCEERRTLEDFVYFAPVISMLDEFARPSDQSGNLENRTSGDGPSNT